MAAGFTGTQNEIPDWLKPYVTGYNKEGTEVDPKGGILGRATAMVDQTPATYDATKAEAMKSVGNRIADFNQYQIDANTGILNLKPSQYLGQGAGLMGMAGTGTYNAATAQQYMDPYMQMVVDQQKKSAIADYQRQMPELQSSAFQAGAGRGTRSALMQSEANRNLQNNLQNIQAQGLQNAWQQGQGQFNTEAGRQLQAGQGLLGAAGTDYAQQTGVLNAQAGVGAAQQNLEQTKLDTAHEDYLAQQREGYQKLGFMSDVLQGVPANAYTSTMYTPSARPSTAVNNMALITKGLGYLGGGGQ
jgi:hypothetical protein